MLDKNIYVDIKNILLQAKSQILKSVNTTIVYTYFEIWKIIVEHEQWWNEKALYGEETLKNLSEELTKEFWKGFWIRNLERMRQFYMTYWKSQTLSANSLENQKTTTVLTKFELSWSHYLILMRLAEQPKEQEPVIMHQENLMRENQ